MTLTKTPTTVEYQNALNNVKNANSSRFQVFFSVSYSGDDADFQEALELERKCIFDANNPVIRAYHNASSVQRANADGWTTSSNKGWVHASKPGYAAIFVTARTFESLF